MTKLIPLSRAVAQVAAVAGFCLLAFACPAAAFSPSLKGGENTPLNLGAPSSASPHTSTGGASLTRTIVGLAIVLAVIWGLWWVLRQVKNGRNDPSVDSDGLASVAALTLVAGRSVHLVRAGTDYVLIGVSEHGLTPIHRYTEEQARAAGLPLGEQDSAPRPRRALLSGSGRLSAPGPPIVEHPLHAGRVDPMRMPAPSSGVVERLREWTVRR
jgi:flagellar protein FliO/FliZ